jgi:hypothetical protein
MGFNQMNLDPNMKHEITQADIMPMTAYGDERPERARQAADIKKDRHMAVGPDATFYFESYDTMWFQVHEMLHIEKGGEEQIADELAAYNPLIPKGRELVATMMIEIEDDNRRTRVLAGLGGIEDTISINVGGERIPAVAEEDVDRTNAAGKASSVQFVHFPFTDQQVAVFRDPATRVVVEIGHPNYAHMALVPGNIRAALQGDFD